MKCMSGVEESEEDPVVVTDWQIALVEDWMASERIDARSMACREVKASQGVQELFSRPIHSSASSLRVGQIVLRDPRHQS